MEAGSQGLGPLVMETLVPTASANAESLFYRKGGVDGKGAGISPYITNF